MSWQPYAITCVLNTSLRFYLLILVLLVSSFTSFIALGVGLSDSDLVTCHSFESFSLLTLSSYHRPLTMNLNGLKPVGPWFLQLTLLRVTGLEYALGPWRQPYANPVQSSADWKTTIKGRKYWQIRKTFKTIFVQRVVLPRDQMCLCLCQSTVL